MKKKENLGVMKRDHVRGDQNANGELKEESDMKWNGWKGRRKKRVEKKTKKNVMKNEEGEKEKKNRAYSNSWEGDQGGRKK